MEIKKEVKIKMKKGTNHRFDISDAEREIIELHLTD